MKRTAANEQSHNPAVGQAGSGDRSGKLLMGICVAVLFLFFLFKVAAFNRLQYFGDIFGFVQVAQGFADGYPLLHENDFGDHKSSHNFYLILLFFPLVRFLGAHGLFVAQLVFHLGALAAIYRLARAETKRHLVWCTWLVFFLGPVGFWLWDDAPYGWHAQILFAPLCLAMAAGLVAERRIAIAAGLLLVLLHEQGAILCWAIHFSVVVIRSGAERSALPWKRLTGLTAAWVAVFACGLLLQSYFHEGDQSRLGFSMSRLDVVTQPPVRSLFIASVVDSLVLLASGALVAVFAGRRAWLALLIAIAVLFVPATIAAMPYTLWWPELRNHAFAWPPRFVAMWSYLGAWTLIAGWHAAPHARRFRTPVIVAVVVVSFVFQAVALEWRRGYSIFERVGNVAAGTPVRLTSTEREFLECLSENIPARSEVLTPPYLFPIFHHHYVWHRKHIPPVKPMADLIVIDMLNRSSYDGTELKRLLRTLEQSGYGQRRVENILAGSSEAGDRAMSRCVGGASITMLSSRHAVEPLSYPAKDP